MYLRKSGTLYNETETQKKIESFNNELREQYRQHNSHTQKESAQKSEEKLVKEANAEGSPKFANDDIILIGLLLLLLKEEKKDYLLIGALAALLLLNN